LINSGRNDRLSPFLFNRKLHHEDEVRVNSATPQKIRAWFKFLDGTFKKYNIKSENIANCDETGSNMQEVAKFTYGKRGKSCNIVIPSDRSHASVMSCIFYTGYRVPEFYLFQGSPTTPVPDHFLVGGQPNCAAVHTKNGYMTKDSFR
jgi:hypothetical protein